MKSNDALSLRAQLDEYLRVPDGTDREQYADDHATLAAYLDWQETVIEYEDGAKRGALAYWLDAAERDAIAAMFLFICQWRFGESVPVPVLTSAEGYYATERIRSNSAIPPDPEYRRRMAIAARTARPQGNLAEDHERLILRILAAVQHPPPFQA